MMWFGEKIETNEEWMNESAWNFLYSKKLTMAQTSSDLIMDTLDRFGKLWTKESKLFKEAILPLVKESGFSVSEAENTLALLPELLSRESLEKRIRCEFTNTAVLDRFTKIPHFQGKVKAVPQGIILHVTAGNVFLSSIDSLIMGFLTKNISILKVSSQNKFFPIFFAEKLKEFDQKSVLADKFAVLSWKGGEKEIESFIKKKVRTIIAWGGEEMIDAYQSNLPREVKFLDFGPKISIQLITKDELNRIELSKLAQKIVQDITPWDQGACASPQNLYLQDGIDEDAFLTELDQAFRLASPRGEISEDEATEILKEKYRALYSDLMNEGKLKSGPEHLIHLEENRYLKPSPLNRSIIVKRFKDEVELFNLLEPFSYYLQSCSYLISKKEKEKYLSLLSLTGIKRFAPIGTITWGMEGAPHDGRFVLRELVQFIGDELRAQNLNDEIHSLQDSAMLKNHFDRVEHPKGYIFSSGGTTGEPKFVHFSYEEFDLMTDMLATNFKAQGIKPGMTVANLFVAGNLWSSFMAVEKALEKIGAIQLPIGGLCQPENILFYLQKFRPQVVLGIPSLLVMTAEHARSRNVELNIPYVFYAGEALSDMRRDYLQHCWGTLRFGSAGYASVDAGVIGYQCEYSGPGEHHVFEDLIDLKIINEEAVVTSIMRDSMPVVNYRTGDKIEWIENCKCGRKDKRFKLLGRIDNVLQIWSCRILLSDIEDAIRDMDPSILTYQVIITEKREMNLVKEKMEILYESPVEINADALVERIYLNSRDLKDTISLEQFAREITITQIVSGKIPRNSRTGKISLVLDQRH